MKGQEDGRSPRERPLFTFPTVLLYFRLALYSCFLPKYSYSVLISVILDTAGRYLSVKRDMHLRITNISAEA